MTKRDYLEILDALEKLPFGMGTKLLTAVLTGDSAHETVRKHRLERHESFAQLSGYSEPEVKGMLARLKRRGLIEQRSLNGKSYFKIHAITNKGQEELAAPGTHMGQQLHFKEAQITKEDEQLFRQLGFFLDKYNPNQKKAITSTSQHILCVAGAGSGKTTVLTKRAEFLTRFRGVRRERVLAITFTRKAREEMLSRLGGGGIRVETFNSFCEQTLRAHGEKLYGRQVRVIQYRDRIRLLHHALRKLNLDMDRVVQTYFTKRQRQDKSKEELLRLFMNDVFSILDYHANNDEPLIDFSQGNHDGRMVYNICLSIRQEMREEGLRDYSDQLTDCLDLFSKHPELIPRYDHLLVDEYQDINAIQKRLLDTLNPKNLFAVGDPRQSIFGWRGSNINFILDFPKHHEGAEVIVLKKNYRSGKHIVDLMNLCIRQMALPDLETHHKTDGTARLHKLSSEEEEALFIAELIRKTETPPENIFVLARTNRHLRSISEAFKARGINHIVRSDEHLIEAGNGQVTLSTAHAIKGMEADLVFVACCNTQSFPCMTSDHPVLELVKRDSHDREEEELRLLYVAISRARKDLHITYSGTQTRFISPEMRKLLGVGHDRTLAAAYKTQGKGGETFQRLREWRTGLARRTGIPPYMIFPDKTLLQLAQEQPTTLPELHGISGIGPAKAEKYGEDLLALLKP